ncbi:MAG: MCP four helix bundle domain-containing protein [Bacteroidetes bacterium]|nr:MCP four helix bundle domain-containing protein [Bacteroidota bacterium]
MADFFKNINLWGRRIIFFFIVLISMLLLLLGISIYSGKRMAENIHRINEYELPSIQLIEEIRQGLALEQATLLSFLLSKDTVERAVLIAQLNEIIQVNNEHFQVLKGIVKPGYETVIYNELILHQQLYSALVNSFVSSKSEMSAEISVKEISVLQKSFSRYRLTINRLAKMNLNDTLEYIDNLEMWVQNSGVAASLVTIFIFLIIIILAYVATQITKRQRKSNELLKIQIKERKRAEEELRVYSEELKHLNENKNQLISVLSHDLRSPATGLLGTAQFLDSNLESLPQEELKKFTGIILHAASRLLDQLNETLHWIKAQSVKEVFHPVPVRVNTIINKVQMLLEENLIQKGIYFYNHTEPSHKVFADVNMLQSIFQNLISNSIKLTPKKGSISVDSKKEDKCIVITISDTGIGMTKEAKDKLFTKETKSTTGTEGEAGTGLGLCLTKEFIEQNGGEISVESEVGKGTSFHIRLKKAF